ncbi:hypothetical protein NADE_007739 [Nannochloris sp. 'desiccata']|nr:hypothetical protein NADE_007739 [Chlorella desiccata (nom. nud.)]
MPTKDVGPVEDSRPAHGKNMGSVRRVLATNQGAVAQAYHQKVIHDPHALHAQGLSNLPTANDAEFWLRKAAGLDPQEAERVLMEALQRDVQPVTSIARALHELHKTVENSPAPTGLHLVVPSQAVNDPLSFGAVPTSLTPGRTGLSGKAFRVPTRLANTPGAAKSHGAAAPQTKFHGILKKLQFSAAPTGTEEKPAAPAIGPTTTTKRLQFESHSKHHSHQTPVGATFLATGAAAATTASTAAAATTTGGLPGGFKSSMRKVTFGGNTVSPSHNPPRRNSVMVGFQTPSAIAEGGSSDEADEEEEEEADGGNGTVNSRNAGATPFDRRLTHLLFTYEGETVVGAGEERKNTAEPGHPTTGTSPVNDLWKRLSSVSATESIKALSASGKMSIDEERKSKEDDCNNNNSGNDSSLESMSLAGSTPVVLVDASVAAAAAVEGENIEGTDISPNTSIASVLGVLLRRSLEDIEASKAAQAAAAPRSLPSSRDAISPTQGVLSMLPAAAEAAHSAGTPTPARSLTPMSVDGVLRDEEGIPIATPSSVTLFRGAAQAPRRNDDSLPADLFRSFTTPPEAEEVVVSRELAPAPYAPAVADFAFNLTGSVRHHQATATTPASAGATAAATPGGASDTASEGTPDLKLKSGAGTGAKTGRHAPSPLRFTPTPSPARKVHLAISQAAASFGKAQRVRTPSPSPVAGMTTNDDATSEQAVSDFFPPASLTKELRGLMNGMSLASPVPAATAVTLNPARASPMQQRELGVKTVVTPVRRSPRVAASVSTAAAAGIGADGDSQDSRVTDMLEAAGFVYVPNPALSTEKFAGDIKEEKEEVNSFRTKGKSSVTPRRGVKAAGAAGAAMEERAVAAITDENSEITPVSRYGLRSASKASNTKSKTAGNRPGSGDKALKLSPTEQNIRNSLRRSSRRQSSTTAGIGS